MRFNLEVDLDGQDTYRVSADGRDIRKWEAANDKSFLGTDLSLTVLAELAFYASKRLGLVDVNWQEFDEKCAWVGEAGESVVAPDPTPKTRGGKRRSG